MITKKQLFFIAVFMTICMSNIFAQPAGDKQINPFHQEYADSLKTMEYNHVFPIFGKKAYKKGFDIPYPYGVGATYFYMKQEIKITNTSIGLNDNEPIDLSNTIHYGEILNTTNIFTVRPDLWVFPFLNVYAVGGYGNSEVIVPIKAVGNQDLNFSTTQHFGVTSFGFGATLAGGIGPVFLTADYNMNWAQVDVVEKPVPAQNLDMRIGHSFANPRRPDRNLTVWVGAFMQTLKAATIGDIDMADVMTQESAEQLKAKLDKLINNPDNDLTTAQREFFEKLVDEGIDKLESSTVHYELDKSIAGPWNFIFGVQYQHNKNWQARIEMGTFGKRSQFMLNLNYRFL